MRPTMVTLAILLAVPALAPAPALAADPVVDEEPWPEPPEEPPDPLWGHWTVGIGVRQIGEDPAGFALSLETDIQRKTWPMGLLFNMNIAAGDGPMIEDPWYGPQQTSVEVIDFGIGARKVFARGKPVQPFLSIGGSVYFVGLYSCEYYGFCSASIDDDVTFGPFADGGLFFATRGRTVFGFRVRYSVGDVTLMGAPVALDGVDVQVSWGMQF